MHTVYLLKAIGHNFLMCPICNNDYLEERLGKEVKGLGGEKVRREGVLPY